MYRWVEHTSEVELEIEAESAPAVFEEALAAVADLIAAEPPQGEELERTIELAATDLPALLADWLAELVYLAESERVVPEKVLRIALDGASLTARVRGRVGEPRQLVKAVTYHRLELAERAGGWHARVVFDV